MKRQFQLLAFIFMISLLQSCEPKDQVVHERGDYTGTWLFTETAAKSSLNTNTVYTVVISLDPSNSSQVLLSHFGGYSGSETAYGIVTSGSIEVPSQSMASDWLVDGSGTLINANLMDWSYSVTAGGDRFPAHATAVRQ
jgi:hypothetical protein